MTLTFAPATLTPPNPETFKHLRAGGATNKQIRAAIKRAREGKIFLSTCGTYQVQVRDVKNGFGRRMVCLSIKRVDREPIFDWRHMQEIKNALLGAECEAMQIFPAESRLVDSANQYWLWGFPDPKVQIPVGFGKRMVTDTPVPGTKQRPFEQS